MVVQNSLEFSEKILVGDFICLLYENLKLWIGYLLKYGVIGRILNNDVPNLQIFITKNYCYIYDICNIVITFFLTYSALVQGIRDLFWLPIEQYQKDGRIVRGLQRGANSFTTSTALAALELTSRLIHLIQVC